MREKKIHRVPENNHGWLETWGGFFGRQKRGTKEKAYGQERHYVEGKRLREKEKKGWEN